MKPQTKAIALNAACGALALLAVLFAVSRIKRWQHGAEPVATVWFYDQNAKRLYAAPHDLIPPDGNDDTRVRAMVIGFKGMADDASQLKIAYLEKYSFDLKRQLERAVAAHAALKPFTEKIPAKGSPEFDDNTFVKRAGEDHWHPLGTAEARQIVSEWHEWRGPDGQAPIISVPSAQ